MKDAVLQMVVTYADKDMLTQAYKQLEWKGYAQMIIDLCRRECGYPIEASYGQTVDSYGDEWDYSLTLPNIQINPVDVEKDTLTWVVVRINKHELEHIRRFAHMKGFKGVASFVIDMLSRKGFINKRKPVVSDSEVMGKAEYGKDIRSNEV